MIPIATPVTYPSITVGGKTYQLRFAHAAWWQIQTWGFAIGDPAKPIPILALAAAAAGEVDAKGRWRSAGFARPIDLADQMGDGDNFSDLEGPVLEALKKAAPAATLSLTQEPAAEPPQAEPPEAPIS